MEVATPHQAAPRRRGSTDGEAPPSDVVGDNDQALDPQVMITLTGRPELKPVADEVSRRLAAALAELTPGTASEDQRGT